MSSDATAKMTLCYLKLVGQLWALVRKKYPPVYM